MNESKGLNTPILLVIFNRPEKTHAVFEEIRKAKPAKFFIAADGPRPGNLNDVKKCKETRSIVENIDWPCEVLRNYSDKNLGCDVRVPSAISWFFENVDGGIILEDDCLPEEDFFTFCQELLEKYRNEPKIMMISGNNFQNGIQRGNGSFYFSRYANTWGWATWKRAWNEFQNDLKDLEEFKQDGKIENILSSHDQQKYWLNFFEKIKKGKYTFWDAKWVFSIWNDNGACITPNKNLVVNIGHDAEGTHTTSTRKESFKNKGNINFPLSYPELISISTDADNYQFASVYQTSIIRLIIQKIKYVISNIKRKIAS